VTPAQRAALEATREYLAQDMDGLMEVEAKAKCADLIAQIDAALAEPDAPPVTSVKTLVEYILWRLRHG
jgi:hypothetical protein